MVAILLFRRQSHRCQRDRAEEPRAPLESRKGSANICIWPINIVVTTKNSVGVIIGRVILKYRHFSAVIGRFRRAGSTF